MSIIRSSSLQFAVEVHPPTPRLIHHLETHNQFSSPADGLACLRKPRPKQLGNNLKRCPNRFIVSFCEAFGLVVEVF